jgi:hypothetical protein
MCCVFTTAITKTELLSVVAPVDLQADTEVLKEYIASIFRIELCSYDLLPVSQSDLLALRCASYIQPFGSRVTVRTLWREQYCASLLYSPNLNSVHFTSCSETRQYIALLEDSRNNHHPFSRLKTCNLTETKLVWKWSETKMPTVKISHPMWSERISNKEKLQDRILLAMPRKRMV